MGMREIGHCSVAGNYGNLLPEGLLCGTRVNFDVRTAYSVRPVSVSGVLCQLTGTGDKIFGPICSSKISRREKSVRKKLSLSRKGTIVQKVFLKNL